MKFFLFLVRYRKTVAFTMLFIAIILKIFIFKSTIYSLVYDFWGHLGLFLATLGVLLRTWAAGAINKGKTLSCNGPYHLCRNPLYTGSLLIAIGLTLVLNSIYLWILILILVLIYIPKVKAEERYLAAIFKDDYQQYKKLTGICYPKKLTIERLYCNWSKEQWINNKEFYTLITVIVGGIMFESVNALIR